jgi:hypothetical protein
MRLSVLHVTIDVPASQDGGLKNYRYLPVTIKWLVGIGVLGY